MSGPTARPPLGASYLLTRQSTKTLKGEKYGVLTGILYLSPAEEGGQGNVCPWSTSACRAVCLRTSGRMEFDTAARARKARTEYFFLHRSAFRARLADEIKSLILTAMHKRMIPMVRLNGTSDIPWEHQGIMEQFPEVQFYDYTKSASRARKARTDPRWPANYQLTFSRSENNDRDCVEVLRAGGNVAVVFSRPPFPATWNGFPVIDGDASDIRPRDGTGVVVGLKAKGEARGVVSGFIVQV